MILLKLSDAKRVEYVILSKDQSDILQHGFVVYKHSITHIDKTSWLPLPEFIGRSKIKFGDITAEFLDVTTGVVKALESIGAFERNGLYKHIDESVKRRTTMEHIRQVYEYIRHNETEQNSLYLKVLKKSCDHLVW